MSEKINDDILLIDEIEAHPTPEQVKHAQQMVKSMVKKRMEKLHKMLTEHDNATSDMEEGMK